MKTINAQKFGEKREKGQTRWYKVVWNGSKAIFRHNYCSIKYGNKGRFGQSPAQKYYNKASA